MSNLRQCNTACGKRVAENISCDDLPYAEQTMAQYLGAVAEERGCSRPSTITKA